MTYSLAENLSSHIFRAYDIRGIVDEVLTPDAVYTLGLAIGSEALLRGEQRIVVGRDGRLSGPSLIEALIAGLIATGCDVLDVGEVPTPVLYFATQQLQTNSGVMLTGSHNPSNYNGLKILLSGVALAEEDIQLLREWCAHKQFTFGQGLREPRTIITDYIRRIAEDVQLTRPLKVVVDCGNGVAGVVAPMLFKALGCEVVELFCEVDGRFPNHHPDPSQPENLDDLIQAVHTHSADVGLAFDGDGDRLGVIDSQGEIIWPDRQLMLYARDILTRHPGAKIIYDVKCSRHVKTVIAAKGGEPLMWKTGHSLIKRKMRETGALLGGEMSGHIFFKERWYGFDDALYTAARLLEILAADLRASHAVFSELPNSVNTPEIKLPMQDDRKFKFIDEFVAKAKFNGAEITTIDGLRADFHDGWGLLRASNTSPYLILRFEANDEKGLETIQQAFREQLLRMDKNLILPF
jgi:phosphomannomutase / phosphoglucomutase